MEGIDQNTNLPTVSVIMLAHNHAPYVCQAIDSVLCQETTFSFEILIGDDASTDETTDILQNYAAQYPNKILLYIRQSNMGATRNLYDLIERAQGRYIAYLECDDYWSDTLKLKKQVEFLEMHSEYIGCTHQITTVDISGSPIKREFAWICKCEHYSIHSFRGIMLPGHISSLMHKNIFAGTDGTYRDLITLHPMIADRPLSMLLASMGNLYQFSQEMSCYRVPEVNPDGATAKLYLNNPREILDEYIFTYKLRKNAETHYGIHADFSPHILELLSRAVHIVMDTFSLFHLYVVIRILLTEHDKKLFSHLIQKLIEKIKR